MANKEHTVIEILDVLRRYQGGDGSRTIVGATGIARNTVRKYIKLAKKNGFTRDGDADLEEIAYAVFKEVHAEDNGQDNRRDRILLPHKERIIDGLDRQGLTLTKVHIKLLRSGVKTSYSSLYRFVQEHGEFGRSQATVRMAETEPGEVAEVDFGRLGYLFDKALEKMRVLHALVVTLLFSRYQYVHVTHRQDLRALIGGIEEAWEFFGGLTRRLVIDNMKTAVIKSHRYEPIFNRTFLEYSQHQGFIIDPAVAHHPQGKATVERQIPYVRDNFFRGEEFVDIEHVQRAAVQWCTTAAGMRVHGTTRKRPRIVFEEQEKALLVPLRGERFDVPQWGTDKKAHPDHHIRFGNALYSVPTQYIGHTLEVRADSTLLRIYHRGVVIKTHPLVAEGKRSTDYQDYPKHKTPYAMRGCDYYIGKAQEVGPQCGSYMKELLSGDFPWSRLRQAQKLIRLSEKYGTERIEQACNRALSFSLIDVCRLERIVTQAFGKETQGKGGDKDRGVVIPARFGRPAEYFTHKEGQRTLWE
jgi:transposase